MLGPNERAAQERGRRIHGRVPWPVETRCLSVAHGRQTDTPAPDGVNTTHAPQRHDKISKLVGWASGECQLLHYRDKDQNEVDLVIEHASGETAGVEVKAAATVNAADFRGLRKLADACGSRFRCGLVLHDGNSVLPFGAHLYAAPVSSLWAASTA